MNEKHVYFFGKEHTEGHRDMKDILGGKGANLAEMAGIGLPVPPGFTVSTEVCNLFAKSGNKIPTSVEKEIHLHMKELENLTGQIFGSEENPLLVSVRSGAKFSMPGMMDTVLNLGLNDNTINGLASKGSGRRFALDCYRRLIHMFGDVVMEISKKKFEGILKTKKAENNIVHDFDLTEENLETLICSMVRCLATTDFISSMVISSRLAAWLSRDMVISPSAPALFAISFISLSW